MYNLLHVEFHKVFRQKSLYVVFLILTLLGGMQAATGNKAITSMDVAVNSISDTSLIFILSLVPLLFVGIDFTNRTIQNAVKAGYSRTAIVFVKMAVALSVAGILHLCFATATVLAVGILWGFSFSAAPQNLALWWVVCVVQCCAVQSFNVFICFVVKNAAISLAAGICFTAVTCNILRNFLEHPMFTYSCFYFSENNELKNLLITLTAAVLVLIFVFIMTCLAFQKSEIK